MPTDLFAENRQCVDLRARDGGIGSYFELVQIQIRQNMEISHVRRICGVVQQPPPVEKNPDLPPVHNESDEVEENMFSNDRHKGVLA